MAEKFEKICSFRFLDEVQVEKYKSNRTGLTLCFVQVPGPLVNGFFCLGMVLIKAVKKSLLKCCN